MGSTVYSMDIPASVEKIGSKAFYETRYESTFLKGEFAIVGGGVLYKYNGNADEVTLPASVKHIGEDAFAYHDNLTSVTIPEGVQDIGGGAFYKCSSLSKIELPDTIKSINVGAFTGCTSLKTVVTGSGIENISDHAFYDCDQLSAFYGQPDSYTEQYAKANGIYFEAIAAAETEAAETPSEK